MGGLASKTTPLQVSECRSKSSLRTEGPKVSESLRSPTSSPREVMKNKMVLESTKSPEQDPVEELWLSCPSKHPIRRDSCRKGNTLHEDYESNPLYKSNISLSCKDDHYAYDNEEGGEGKKCDGFRRRNCRAPGINTRYITDYEASLAGCRCSNSNKLDTPGSQTSLKSERSFSPVSDAESNRKNDQAIGQSRVEYLHGQTVQKPILQKPVSLPLRNSSKIKTVEVSKPERKKLKYCTLEEIIQRVNHPFWSDGCTKRTLLICYRAFCTRRQLLAALEKFYDDPKLPPDFHMWVGSKHPSTIAEAKTLMRIKMLNLIRYWLREFFYDFDNDDFQHFQKWTSRILATGDDTTSECVKSVLREMSFIKEGKSAKRDRIFFQFGYPDSLYQEQKTPETIWDVRSKEIARQMCLIDHEIFSSIRPHEFLGQSWWKNCKVEAPNIFRLIEHFNQVSCWCKVMIISQNSRCERTRVLGRMLSICFCLDSLGNLNSFCAIMTGIISNAISRLQWTVDYLKPKHRNMLTKFKEIIKADRNQMNLRKRLAGMVEPGIPHIGLLLQDLASIDTLNDNSKEGKINFKKYTLINDRIEWYLKFQAHPFNFRPLERVQEELRRGYISVPNEHFDNLSRVLEPHDY